MENKLKRTGARTQPCFTLLETWKDQIDCHLRRLVLSCQHGRAWWSGWTSVGRCTMPVWTRGPLCWLYLRPWWGWWIQSTSPGSALCISLEPVSLRMSCLSCCTLGKIHTQPLVDWLLTWSWANSGCLGQESSWQWRGVRCLCSFCSQLCCLYFCRRPQYRHLGNLPTSSLVPRCNWGYHGRHWLLLGLQLCTTGLGFYIFCWCSIGVYLVKSFHDFSDWWCKTKLIQSGLLRDLVKYHGVDWWRSVQ